MPSGSVNSSDRGSARGSQYSRISRSRHMSRSQSSTPSQIHSVHHSPTYGSLVPASLGYNSHHPRANSPVTSKHSGDSHKSLSGGSLQRSQPSLSNVHQMPPYTPPISHFPAPSGYANHNTGLPHAGVPQGSLAHSSGGSVQQSNAREQMAYRAPSVHSSSSHSNSTQTTRATHQRDVPSSTMLTSRVSKWRSRVPPFKPLSSVSEAPNSGAVTTYTSAPAVVVAMLGSGDVHIHNHASPDRS